RRQRSACQNCSLDRARSRMGSSLESRRGAAMAKRPLSMYESHFGLTLAPFSLNPDPSFFFGSRGHNSALSYLKFGVYQAEGFVVVTGDIGAGKTMLVRTLLAELDP